MYSVYTKEILGKGYTGLKGLQEADSQVAGASLT